MEINELKDKVLSALGQATGSARGMAGNAAGSAKSIAGTAAEKIRSGGKIAKLSMETASAREELKKTYLEIGKLYYDTHKDDPEGFFVQLFEEVRITEEDIAAKEEEMASLKESIREAFKVEEDDFSDVVDRAEVEVEITPLDEEMEEETELYEEARAEAAETREDVEAEREVLDEFQKEEEEQEEESTAE